MALENDVKDVDIIVIPKGPEFEECPHCGGKSYIRCGAVGRCYDELCPSNDNEDYA